VKTDSGRRLAVVNVLRLGDEYLRGIAEVVPNSLFKGNHLLSVRTNLGHLYLI